MEILGIGPSELVFIILIAIIVLGPRDMQKAGRTIGRWLNQLVKSDGWKALQQTSREIRNLPQNLMKEANMDLQETGQAIRKELDIRPSRSIASHSIPNPSIDPKSMPLPKEAENSIQPPATESTERKTDTEPND